MTPPAAAAPRHWRGLGALALVGALPGAFLFAVLWVIGPLAAEGGWSAARAMRSFANIWAAGGQALSGDLLPLADAAAWSARLREVHGPRFDAQHTWGYPPTMLLFAAPLAALPLGAAFAVWTVGGLLALWLALRSRAAGPVPATAAALVLASPASVESALAGQTGALAAALLFGALVHQTSRPAAAGAMLGALAAKPQIGLLVPVCLAARGSWRCFGWAAAFALGLAALSLVAFGRTAWEGFLFGQGAATAARLSAPWNGEPWQVNFASPLYAARALGAPVWAAWSLQAVLAALAVGLCWVAGRRAARGRWPVASRDPLLLAGFAAAAELLAAPYSHNYDAVILSCAVAGVALSAARSGSWLPGERAILGLAWAWPGVPVAISALGMGPTLGWSGPVFCALASAGVAWCAWRRMSSGPERGAAAAPGMAGRAV